MDRYLTRDALYARSMTPYHPAQNAPEIIRHMAEKASKAGIGRMGAVARAVAKEIGHALRSKFNYMNSSSKTAATSIPNCCTA